VVISLGSTLGRSSQPLPFHSGELLLCSHADLSLPRLALREELGCLQQPGSVLGFLALLELSMAVRVGIPGSSALSLSSICFHSFLFFFFFFLLSGTGDWTQVFMLTKQVFCLLSHSSSPLCSGYFGEWGLTNYLAGLSLNCDLPNLSLPSS
jgi:hypothetical protein